MHWKSNLLAVLIIVFLSTLVLSCGNKDEEPIYQPDATDEERYTGGENVLYDIEGHAEGSDISEQEEYVSPFGPKYPKHLQWASSISDALGRARPGSGKKVLVWWVNRGCKECDKIEKEVFSSDTVLKEAHKYIWVKVDVDADPENTKYYIQDGQPPLLQWLSQDGISYHRMFGGFDDPELVARVLRDKH